jgi:hypothetical protein
VNPSLPEVKLRHKTIITGVIIAAPAMLLATSGTIEPWRNPSFIDFQLAVAYSLFPAFEIDQPGGDS